MLARVPVPNEPGSTTPKDGTRRWFPQHVDRRGQVVTPADVAQFVSQDRFQLIRRQAPGNALGKQQNGLADAEHARFKPHR